MLAWAAVFDAHGLRKHYLHVVTHHAGAMQRYWLALGHCLGQFAGDGLEARHKLSRRFYQRGLRGAMRCFQAWRKATANCPIASTFTTAMGVWKFQHGQGMAKVNALRMQAGRPFAWSMSEAHGVPSTEASDFEAACLRLLSTRPGDTTEGDVADPDPDHAQPPAVMDAELRAAALHNTELADDPPPPPTSPGTMPANEPYGWVGHGNGGESDTDRSGSEDGQSDEDSVLSFASGDDADDGL